MVLDERLVGTNLTHVGARDSLALGASGKRVEHDGTKGPLTRLWQLEPHLYRWVQVGLILDFGKTGGGIDSTT